MPNNLGFAGSLKVEEIFHSNVPHPPPLSSPLLSLPPPIIEISVVSVVNFHQTGTPLRYWIKSRSKRKRLCKSQNVY
jgi:hypothetical protein